MRPAGWPGGSSSWRAWPTPVSSSSTLPNPKNRASKHRSGARTRRHRTFTITLGGSQVLGPGFARKLFANLVRNLREKHLRNGRTRPSASALEKLALQSYRVRFRRRRRRRRRHRLLQEEIEDVVSLGRMGKRGRPESRKASGLSRRGRAGRV